MANAFLAEIIADEVSTLYDKLPTSGKPRDSDEYTVLAAITAQDSPTSGRVVALATGTKCIGPDYNNDKGCLVSDSHGEVLAKRSFVRYLGDWIVSVIEEPSRTNDAACPFQWNTEENKPNSKLSIKPNWKFQLYISDSPCGDASIYASDLIEADGVNPIGAKLVPTSDQSANSTDNAERPGGLRTKSGRSDIKAEDRTTSMSCSDKVCRWSFLGLQGALLSLWMEPVRLSDLVVDQDPSTTEEAQKEALLRALHHRVFPSSAEGGVDSTSVSEVRAPNVLIAGRGSAFPRSKAAVKHAEAREYSYLRTGAPAKKEESSEEPPIKRHRSYISPCGTSLNWYRSSPATRSALSATFTNPSRPSKPRKIVEVAGGTLEVTIAHTGALQGSTAKSLGEIGTSSRLSPYAMRAHFEHIVEVLEKHRADSALHQTLHDIIAGKLLLLQPSDTASSAPATITEASSAVVPEAITSSAAANTSSTTSTTTQEESLSLLAQVRQLSRRELKTRCGQCHYNTAKAQFLCHPVFKDWICDE